VPKKVLNINRPSHKGKKQMQRQTNSCDKWVRRARFSRQLTTAGIVNCRDSSI